MSENVVLAAGDSTSRSTAPGRNHSESLSQNNSARRIEGRNIEGRSVSALAPGRVVNKSSDKSVKIFPEHVLRSFNTWSFKREQPSDLQLMLKVIADVMERGVPLPFLFYWGKGPRCHVDEHDIKCLEYIEAIAHRVSAVYPIGAAIRLIFTNTHATLNGYAAPGMNNYFAEVEVEARKRGFECYRLGDLIEVTQATAEDDQLHDHVPGDVMAKLFTSAMKWYHGAGTAEEGAIKYFHMNMVEKRAVELAFPTAIFTSFNSSKFRILFPKRLPIFYMYSLQRGVGVKPWFLPAEAQLCDAATCECAAKAEKESAERP